jgi:uncharacterized protein (TIGR03067 family)
MKRVGLVSAVLALGLVAVGCARDQGEGAQGQAEDIKAIDGVWHPVEGELGGRELPETTLETLTLTLAAGTYTVRVDHHLDKGTITLDPHASPKTIDIHGTEGPNKGLMLPAIYELTGDTLRVCYDLSGQKRPAAFMSMPDTEQFLVLYRREKY